jgi:hypothetical protein
MNITRIESREAFPVPQRCHYIWKLSEGTITFFVEGRPMNEEKEIGSVLANYIQALNKAENQIELLLKIIKESEVDKDYFDEYLDEFPEEEDYKGRYKIEDIKDSLFHSMMKKDEKLISKYLNQLNVVTEKQKP